MIKLSLILSDADAITSNLSLSLLNILSSFCALLLINSYTHVVCVHPANLFISFLQIIISRLLNLFFFLTILIYYLGPGGPPISDLRGSVTVLTITYSSSLLLAVMSDVLLHVHLSCFSLFSPAHFHVISTYSLSSGYLTS